MKKTSEVKKYNKSNLPTKVCAHCDKSAMWRKCWAKVRAEVKYCSERRRRSKNQVAAD